MNDLDDARPATLAAPARDPRDRRRRAVAMGLVCGLLLLAAVGLNASVAALELTFRKLPVPLRQEIASIPPELGPWVQVTLDERFPEDVEAELGTKDYLKRFYVDTRKADPAVLARYRAAEAKTPEVRSELQRSVLSRDATAGIWLHIAYYTGGVDTVPHIPDRCMVAGGFDPVGKREQVLQAGDRQITSSYVQFEQRAGQAQPTTFHVAYFFQVNGDYEYDAITGVRKRLQNLTERHAYFAKIELTVQEGAGRDSGPALESMGQFLGEAMPAIEAVLPDWNQVKAQAEVAGR